MGRVVLGAKNEDLSCRCNGLGSAGLIIFQLPDANALEVGDAIRAKMEELKKNFPDDLDYVIRYDTTPFTRQCIDEVVKALRDAIILVALVVLLFLQNWRSAIIPLIAVPVAIIGTFAVMYGDGFQPQQPHALRPGAGDRHRGGRRDRGGRGGGAPHRERPAAAGRHAQGHEPGFRAGGGRGPGAERGLRALRVHQRHHRPVLPAVRPDHRRLDGHLGLQFLDAQPGAVGPAVASAGEGARGEVLPRLAYALAGGWVAWRLATPEWPRGWEARSRWPRTLAAVTAAAPWIAAVAGAVAGWARRSAANFVLGRAFRLFNDAFARATNVYLRGVGMLLRTSALVLVVYCGMLGLTYWSYVTHAQGLRPHPGHGIPAGDLPTAGCGLGRADRGA